MPGYSGKILRVDLSRGETSVENPPDSFYRAYLGGRALAAYYLLREVPAGAGPFDPENLFILAPGVLTGFAIPGASRCAAASLSPLTGGFGNAEGGGFFPAELKRAGWDAIVVKGKARAPTWLHIVDDKVELRDGRHLAGKTTGEVEEAIRRELAVSGSSSRKVRIAQCGPAAERGVRFANVVFDLSHFAGRSGNGAVMASKNLRAVAVSGSSAPEPADPAKLKELLSWYAEKGYPEIKGFGKYGTSDAPLPQDGQGGLPTRNFRDGTFEGAAAIDATTWSERLLSGTHSCFACPVGCKRNVTATAPYAIDPAYGGPEYESLAALGSTCGVADIDAVCKANELCAAYGLDTISTGVSIAFAMECYETGLIGPSETDGLELRFGNGAALVEMVGRIARREGLGDLLAEGVKRAAERIGGRASEFAIHVKGQEVPMHEPRVKHALGLGYEVSPTGADHVHNVHDTDFVKSAASAYPFGILDPLPADYLGPEKVRLYYYLSNWAHLLDSVMMCAFLNWKPDQVAALVGAVTGFATSVWEMEKVGERAANLARLFNLSRGLGEETDRLPRRFYQAFTKGVSEGQAVSEAKLDEARRLYYAMSGWDEGGVPSEGKLAELDIRWAVHQGRL